MSAGSQQDTLSLSLKPHNQPGRLVTFSGVDGSGKTTLANAALQYIRSRGHRVHLVSLLAPEILTLSAFRDYAHDPHDSLGRSVDMFALSLVCCGSRLLTIRTKVLPLLQMGHWVVCDRYVFTTLAELQAFEVPETERKTLNETMRFFPKPDIAFLALCPPQTCIDRIRLRENEAGKHLDLEHYEVLVRSFQRVASANGLLQISTDHEPARSEALVTRALDEIIQPLENSRDGSRARAN